MPKLSPTDILLRRLARQRWVWLTLSSWGLALPLTALLWMVAASLEALFWFGPAERTPLLIVTLVLASLPLLAALFATMSPFWRRSWYDPENLAHEILERDPEIRDQLLVAVQLSKKLRDGMSEELRDSALMAINDIAAKLSPKKYAGTPFVALLNRIARWTLLGCGVLILLAGRALWPATHRLAHPSTQYERPQAPALEMTMPDTVTVTEGDSLLLTATGKNLSDRQVQFRVEDGSGQPRIVNGRSEPDQPGPYSANLANLRRSATVQARAGRVASDTVWVEVIHRPRIAHLNVTIQPPAYTGLDEVRLPSGVGDVVGLAGSRVRVRLEASRTLSTVRLHVSNDEKTERSFELTVEGQRARGSYMLSSGGKWWVELTAYDGTPGDEPVHWRLSTIEDEGPSVSILLPEPDALIPDNLLVPLVADARDDYGISRMSLRWDLVSAMFAVDSTDLDLFAEIPLNPEILASGRAEVRSGWSLSDLPLLPTDEVHYYVEAWDNDVVAGPKRARTEVRKLLFPSVEELLTRSDEEELAARDELTRAHEEAKKLEQRLRETLQRMQSNPEDLSWEEAQALQKALDEQQKTVENLDEVREAIEQLEELASQHKTLSKELIEKYQQVQSLLEEIATPEMRAAMEQLQQALEEVDGERVREALQKLLENQEAMTKNLERSIEVLKRLHAEKRLNELATLAEELAERQKEVSEASDSATLRDIPRLTREQQLVRDDFATLNRRLSESASDTSEIGAELADSLASVEEMIAQMETQNLLEQARSSFETGKTDQASQQSRQATEQLQQIAERLRAIHEQMLEQGKQDVADRMNALFDGILVLSHLQEELRTESLSLGVASPRYRRLAADQRSLADATGHLRDDVEELRRKTFFINSSLDVQLELSGEAMEKALEGYTGRQPTLATNQQAEAMAMLHRALLNLNQSMREMQQASSGTGYDEMMERLQQMAQQQQQLNQGSDMPLPGGASQSMMQEMAARQRALAEQMRQMERDSRGQGAREILGNLEGLSDAMEQVAKDLDERNVTNRTRRLQRRILQRLLDSQRSLAQQDLSRERVGRVSEDLDHDAPGQLSLDDENELRRRLERALEGDWDESWRETIRAYFRALQREETIAPSQEKSR